MCTALSLPLFMPLAAALVLLGPIHAHSLCICINSPGAMVAMAAPEPHGLPAQLFVMAYGLLILLMTALFTANTAAQVRSGHCGALHVAWWL